MSAQALTTFTIYRIMHQRQNVDTYSLSCFNVPAGANSDSICSVGADFSPPSSGEVALEAGDHQLVEGDVLLGGLDGELAVLLGRYAEGKLA